MQEVRDQRLGELEAVRLQLLCVVGRVVGHHDRRRIVEPLHEQAGLLVGGEAHRAAHPVQPALAKPGGRRVQEGRGCLVVAPTLVEAEEPGVLALIFDVTPVVYRRYSAHRAAVSQGQERLSLGVVVKRMPLRIHHHSHVSQKRWHPDGVAFVDRPREADERLHLIASR